MVGDLLQLPPVVSQVESSFFAEHYASAYFFSAHVMENSAFVLRPYTLEKVYRQEDTTFVELLHRIRENTIISTDIDTINTRVQRVTTIESGEIYLTTTNARANQVNATMLERLPGQEFRAFARTKGKLSASAYPADDELIIKQGAQVMFVVNDPDKRFVNGTIGTIVDISEYEYDDEPNSLEVDVRINEREELITVTAHTWEMREARYDEKEKVMTSEVVGAFEQLPIRLAWACTIHKAQGKTFDRMIIDAGNGMFAAGQAYVALSRCTSLEGIKLVKPLTMRDILIDDAVRHYLHNAAQQQAALIATPQPPRSLATAAARASFAARIQKEAPTHQAVLVFDTETTGVDAKARIVQICCALYEKDVTGQRTCSTLVNEYINP
jgi:ATP-dependent DNA helicase PIF1